MKKYILLLFSFLVLIGCKDEKQFLYKIEGKQVVVDGKISADEEITKLIAPYKDTIEVEINKVLTFTKKDLNRYDGKLESSLGNLLADLAYEQGNPIFHKMTGKNVDFSVFNYGGIRANIPTGPVTYRNAFQLMPFENTLVVAEITGEKMKMMIDYLHKAQRAHPISKHFRITIKNDQPHKMMVNGEDFDVNRNYYVLTSDYLQNGGDNMVFFKDPVNLYKLDYKLRGAIIDYFLKQDTLRVTLDGRFQTVD
ncbi:5'-nucleotidase C-terminal domain-containing protein [Aureivirga sp. CE67]|uniref:5'-nucleotidase C-terminal domain-containing protein n=1 Tax=Aureivirga sp. CE67 TaxID=1788983 RepID=UPI0018CA0DC7|nr:5'-nucleotidase [Aureivirga sp. CE67]